MACDGELLERYARTGAEDAFGEVVRRHGPMVLAACRRLAPADAEDAAQAVFLVLARRAARLARHRDVGPWLYRTSTYVARTARRERLRRERREKEAAAMRQMRQKVRVTEAERAEVERKLDAAIASLPERYRRVLVLCYLEGATQGEAARRLGLPMGTVAARAKRGLARLRAKLARSGAMLGAAVLGPLLIESAGVGAAAFGASGLLPALASASRGAGARPAVRIETLARGGMRAMTIAKVKAAALAVAGLVAAGGLALAATKPLDAKRYLPPPPFEFKFWDGWFVEHVAFTLGQSGRPVGGPARWAVGGCLPGATTPVEQEGKLYTGAKDGDGHMFFSDQRRRFWILEEGEVWPIAGSDDVGELDGPGPYARFIYTGVYGGHHDGMKATGHTLYVADNGWLRRIQRAKDSTWQVQTVAGQGASRKIPPGGMKLADLGALGKGLAIDPEGRLYFTMGGGLVVADPGGKATWVVTREKVGQDFTALYAKKWPGAKVARTPSLGSGEGVGLAWNPKGIYGGGRTWPQAWKVTFDGTFVPLVNYAPKDKLVSGKRWGPGDPGTYQVHCPMGFGVCEDGVVWMEHEQPSARCRFEEGVVKVLGKDYTWKALPWGSKDYLNYLQTNGMSVNGLCTMAVGNAPGRAFHGRTVYLRARREK